MNYVKLELVFIVFFGILTRVIVLFALIVQWIEREFPELKMGVRFPLGALVLLLSSK
jgi:hypothetical protein